jgi:hypothetical protein
MDSYHRLRERARQLSDDNPMIACPFFAEPIVLNGEGLHHLRYSADQERSKTEQMVRFRLLSLALEVVRNSGTVQEYRRIWQAIGKPSADGMRPAKEVEYSGLVAIIGPRPDKIRVILRRVGTGNITLWSVMRGSKIMRDGTQRLAPDNLEAE